MDQIQRNEKIEYLRMNLSNEARFQQLAEECSELIQASLKFLRAIGDENPTPIPPGQAMMNLLEEATDVYLCMTVNSLIPARGHLFDKKLDRWCDRVKEAKNAG